MTIQHRESHGCVGIFNETAKLHDSKVARVEHHLFCYLKDKFPSLQFRHRISITKEEINNSLRKIDPELGQTLFIHESRIRPDGGIIEVKDDLGNWRVVLVSEAKHQGRDVENITKGQLVGKNKDQDLMAAGNAIERAYKNIFEISNYMLCESYFPYVLFLEGSNFLTKNLAIARPDGRIVTLDCNSGVLNRLDRLTAANYGMALNTNLCMNKFIKHKDKTIMLQATSIYTQGDGEAWNEQDMFNIMHGIALTSIKALATDLFDKLTNEK